MSPSRQFKENFVVGGCFLISLIAFVLILASFHLWYFLPVIVMIWLFTLWQSVRMGIWRRKADKGGDGK